MPKVVDRAQQRRDIGAALLRLLAREGLEEVSVRTVAAEAGRSAGAVQKYFSSKDELLRFALDLTGERATERLLRVDPAGPTKDVLRRYVEATLPLDEDRRAEAVVWAAFAVRGALRADFGAVLAEVDREVRGHLAELLGAALAAGRIRQDLDPFAVADALIAVSDGLSVRLLYNPDDQAVLLTALDTALTALLGAGTDEL
ncbi:TetR family transcriptional regulator [Solihabitans fulvus]|uniref:TetR family transcriptional regulator n=1 Tax=Solihabitans fulvus TaxID=1892852 RepID=A0A5B2XGP3_9PSEU|nr:TetR family transcriptional regulator C-terminal domain-containing protein [Solihabitans fulvus]KAA2262416.1 TetR family transcriptional regulator [Solihabitans fulvus]